VPAELLELAGHLVALELLLEDQERDAVVAALLGRLDRCDEEVRAHAVGDEGFGAVHHVAAVDALGEGLDAGHVGAGVRLGDSESGDLLALDRRDEIALLLVLRAELPHGRRRDPDVGADPGRHAAGAAARQLFRENRVVHVVTTLAAVLLGVLEPEEPELGHAREDLVGKPASVLPLHRVRGELVLHEAPDRLAELLVLVGEGRDRPPSLRDRGVGAHSVV
jgi:hypothetical protein